MSALLISMKTKLILSAVLMLAAVAAGAQTKYYQNDTTYVVGSNILKATIKDKYSVILYDAKARFLNIKQTAKDGGPVSRELASPSMAKIPFTNYIEVRDLTKKIIGESLSKQSKQLARGYILGVKLIFNPETGKVWEAHLHFNNLRPVASIPPTEFNTIINRLKTEIEAQMIDAGRDLNYADVLTSCVI